MTRRRYLPITSKSIIWKGRFKLITYAPPTNFYTPDDTRIPDNSSGCGNWTRDKHKTNASSPVCLYDLVVDESETINLWAQHPDIVQELSAQLATYTQYTVREKRLLMRHCSCDVPVSAVLK